MGRLQNDSESKSVEERMHHRLQVLYARRMHERQLFMDDLKQYRAKVEKRKLKEVTEMLGPVWYQVLSMGQRNALDRLKDSIHNDLIEGRPFKVTKDIKELGITPRPNSIDLMNCIFVGRNCPKEMLSILFQSIYGYPVSSKRSSYPLNARLILTGIFYLGLQEMFYSLDFLFRTEVKPDEQPRRRLKRTYIQTSTSPYLQKMTATLNTRPKKKRTLPLPIPSIDLLNDDDSKNFGFDVAPSMQATGPSTKQTQASATMQERTSTHQQRQLHNFNAQQPQSSHAKQPQPTTPTALQLSLPPIPQIKNRKQRHTCDKLAGVYQLIPDSETVTKSLNEINKRKRKSQFNFDEVKKSLGVTSEKKKKIYNDKPHSLPAPLPNVKYVIKGISVVNERTYYTLETVTILPAQGDLHHGGFTVILGQKVNIHLGYRGRPPPPPPQPCECVDKWHEAVFNYIQNSKCNCGHRYDFYNEGKFPAEEVPFFHKPTVYGPHHFDCNTIFEMNKHSLHVAKEFKRIWETDSMLRVVETEAQREGKRKGQKDKSGFISDEEPQPEDYLKYAMQSLHRQNEAATLPDVYQAPELREWMRRRMRGPVTKQDKAQLKYKSNVYWQMFSTLSNHGYGHVPVQGTPEFSANTDWLHKLSLNDKFVKYKEQYKLQWFKAQSRLNNLLWPTMFQEVLPDKHFREIYFAYLQAKANDVQMMHPYCPRESHDRNLLLHAKK